MSYLGIFECRVVTHCFECKRVRAVGSGKVKFCLGDKQEFSFGFIRFEIFVRLPSENLFNIFFA